MVGVLEYISADILKVGKDCQSLLIISQAFIIFFIYYLLTSIPENL